VPTSQPAARSDLGGAGILLVDKPAGPTSHDVVNRVRRERGGRVGHAGTLDPFATGLLIVLVGREATRCQSRFMALAKTYRAVARFGAVSTTGDPDGEITKTGRVPPADLELPTGRIRQRPPAYSAVKVGGIRAYRRARRGEEVALPEREVTVHRFEQLWREGERACFEIECSSGTYVRSLIADLGDAYTESLRRTQIGPFSVTEAEGFLPLAAALARLDAERP
jgi:tRNA pseudouridine55 synthase